MMKRQILLFLGFIFISAIVGSAQTKTVTNADLEKFRQKRVQSEQDYRDNYQKLGLPSPEELEKQREQNRKELSELSGRRRFTDSVCRRRLRFGNGRRSRFEGFG